MMKKLMWFGLALALAVTPLILTSCGKDNPVAPSITAEQTTTPVDTTSGRIGKPGADMYGGALVDQNWWRSLSQAQRDAAVLDAAIKDYDERRIAQNTLTPYYGDHCKIWVQKTVVPRASHNVAEIPKNYSNTQWEWGKYVAPVGYGPAGVPIEGARPGHIIQMEYAGGPHTAIIRATDPYGMWWIDCNFANPWDFRLRVHYVSYGTFKSKVTGYTVYQVIGG